MKPGARVSDEASNPRQETGTTGSALLLAVLANVLLDEVDKALERRGHCFVRYADDCSVYVGSRRAGERVMSLLRRCYAKLRLSVNETKSTVASVAGRKFLGYALWRRQGEVKRAWRARHWRGSSNGCVN